MPVLAGSARRAGEVVRSRAEVALLPADLGAPGRVRIVNSSCTSSPSASIVGRICTSVCTSISSRAARPARSSEVSSTQPTRAQAIVGGVELRARPRPGAAVAAHRQAPVQLAEQADLGGVHTGRDPRVDVRVAAVLAEHVAHPPHRADRRVGQRQASAGRRTAAALPVAAARPRARAARSLDRCRRAPRRGSAPAARCAPSSRACADRRRVGALSSRASTAGTTASGLNTPNAAATSSPGTCPITEPRLVKYAGPSGQRDAVRCRHGSDRSRARRSSRGTPARSTPGR